MHRYKVIPYFQAFAFKFNLYRYTSSTAARSPATCPTAALLAASAVAPARRRAASVAAALMSKLRGEWRLQRSLTALRAVYLGGAGVGLVALFITLFCSQNTFS